MGDRFGVLPAPHPGYIYYEFVHEVHYNSAFIGSPRRGLLGLWSYALVLGGTTDFTRIMARP